MSERGLFLKLNEEIEVKCDCPRTDCSECKHSERAREHTELYVNLDFIYLYCCKRGCDVGSYMFEKCDWYQREEVCEHCDGTGKRTVRLVGDVEVEYGEEYNGWDGIGHKYVVESYWIHCVSNTDIKIARTIKQAEDATICIDEELIAYIVSLYLSNELPDEIRKRLSEVAV